MENAPVMIDWLAMTVQQIMQSIKGIYGGEDGRMARDAPNAQRANRQKPEPRDGAEGPADPCGASRLHGKKGDEDRNCGWHDIGLKGRRGDIESLKRREDQNRRGYPSIAVNERGAKQMNDSAAA
jgi:hypothetical protein